jgi:cytochrome c oxidase assembly protein subunit 15
MDERLARYRGQLLRWNRLTLTIVLLLILAGGIVRSSGSGMGCPDWPLCFGQWIPPIYEADLPANYQEIYAERGYKDTRFNALKTWIEYLNRLLGAFTGLFVGVQAVLAWRLWRTSRLSRENNFQSASNGSILWAMLALLLVLVQGGIGAWVVATHLQGSVVTLHLVLAWVLMAVQLWLGFALTLPSIQGGSYKLLDRWGLGLWLVLLFAQLGLGALVREAVDAWMPTLASDSFSFKALGEAYLWHKNLWMLLLMGGAWLAYRQWTLYGDRQAGLWAGTCIGLLMVQVLSGLWMVLFGLPAIPRTLHILLGSLSLVSALGWWTRQYYLHLRRPS